MSKNQPNYFTKICKILEELKKDNPDVDICRHLVLATDNNDLFGITDKELYESLQKHKTELDINTLSDKDLQKVIEDTEELFRSEDPLFGIYLAGTDPYRKSSLEDDEYEDI